MFLVPPNKLLLSRVADGKLKWVGNTAFFTKSRSQSLRRRSGVRRTDPALTFSRSFFRPIDRVFHPPSPPPSIEHRRVLHFRFRYIFPGGGLFFIPEEEEEVESEDRTLCYLRTRTRTSAQIPNDVDTTASSPLSSRLFATVRGRKAPNLIIVAKIPHPDPYKSFHTSQLRQHPAWKYQYTHTLARSTTLWKHKRAGGDLLFFPSLIDSSSDT